MGVWVYGVDIILICIFNNKIFKILLSGIFNFLGVLYWNIGII